MMLLLAFTPAPYAGNRDLTNKSAARHSVEAPTEDSDPFWEVTCDVGDKWLATQSSSGWKR